MAPRDSYLSLCLEQASKSTEMHHRHGSIIVRGGKVIGQGHNDYRPGFDGGLTLKTGKLAASASSSPAIVALKQRIEAKSKQFCQSDEASEIQLATTENSDLGGGCLANIPPLAALHQPRNQVTYNALARHRFKGRNFNHPHLVAVKKEGQERNEEDENENARSLPLNSAVKDRKTYLYGHHHSLQQNHHVHHHASEAAQQAHNHKAQSRAVSSAANSKEKARDPTSRRVTNRGRASSDPLKSLSMVYTPKPRSLIALQENLAMSSHFRNSPTLLLPQSLKTSSTQNVKARMKDQRLRGCDLYVARLRWGETEDRPPSPEGDGLQTDVQNGVEVDSASDDDCQPVKSLTRSLHDELRFRKPKESHLDAQRPWPLPKKQMATLSRLCYRCISYMHSAGIKRVFWTNTEGIWEGAKVQELVDVLEGSSPSAGDGRRDGSDKNAAFVTKHEILMLRKTMGH